MGSGPLGRSRIREDFTGEVTRQQVSKDDFTELP